MICESYLEQAFVPRLVSANNKTFFDRVQANGHSFDALINESSNPDYFLVFVFL
jgi:hypothetical protein